MAEPAFVCDNFLERCGPDGGTRPRSICHICLQPRALHLEPVDDWYQWLIRGVLEELREPYQKSSK
jgi:hypothetical protein